MGGVPFTNADVSKAHRLLGYESNVTMEEGIKKTVEWYQGAFGGMGSWIRGMGWGDLRRIKIRYCRWV